MPSKFDKPLEVSRDKKFIFVAKLFTCIATD
jgi:hypothetical protein